VAKAALQDKFAATKTPLQSTHKDTMTMASTAAVMPSCGVAIDRGVAAGNSTDGAARHEHNANLCCGETNANNKDGHQPAPASKYNLRQTFASLPTLFQSFEDFAAAEGFVVGYQSRDYFKEEDWPFPTPIKKEKKRNITKRGVLYCSPKSQCCPNKEECPVKYVYGFDKKKDAYVFREDSSHTTHNHVLLPPTVENLLDGKFNVKFEQQLSPAEEQYINEQVLCKIDIPNMQENLERTFPGRCYDHTMLHRISKKVLDNKYGKDRKEFHWLMDLGDTINHNGGLFTADPNPEDFSIDAFHCQTKIQKMYASIYGDFILGDGTHGMSREKGVFVFTVVDCLLRSKIAGWTQCLTENSNPICRGAKAFFPSNKSTSLEKSQLQVEVCELGSEFFDPFQDSMTKVDVDSEGDKVGNEDEELVNENNAIRTKAKAG
jgi:hypothetical protein